MLELVAFLACQRGRGLCPVDGLHRGDGPGCQFWQVILINDPRVIGLGLAIDRLRAVGGLVGTCLIYVGLIYVGLVIVGFRKAGCVSQVRDVFIVPNAQWKMPSVASATSCSKHVFRCGKQAAKALIAAGGEMSASVVTMM